MPHSTRGDLARDAYPGLETHARRFAAGSGRSRALMAIVLILTASAYWDVGFGRTVVQRIEQTNKERARPVASRHQSGAGVAVLVTETSCAAPAGLPDDQARACAQLASLTQCLKDWRADLFHFAVAVTGERQVSAADISGSVGCGRSVAAFCSMGSYRRKIARRRRSPGFCHCSARTSCPRCSDSSGRSPRSCGRSRPRCETACWGLAIFR